MFGTNQPSSSSPFGGAGENAFQQQTPTFGQTFRASTGSSVFGSQTGTGSTASSSASNLGNTDSTSTNLFSSAGAQTGTFGITAPTVGTTASGQNLFAQFTSSSSAIEPSSTGSVFGGAKLFGSSESRPSKSDGSIFHSGTLSGFGDLSGSQSASNVFTGGSKPAVLFGKPQGAVPSTSASTLFKESARTVQPQTLFGKPIEGSGSNTVLFGAKKTTASRKLDNPTSEAAPEQQTKSNTTKARVLFGKEVDDNQAAKDDDAVLVKQGQDLEAPDGDNVFEVKKQLFGKTVTEKPGRKSLIKRDERSGGSAARSIFNKALFGATGKPAVPRAGKEEQIRDEKPRISREERVGRSSTSRALRKGGRSEVEDELASMAGKEAKPVRRLSRALSSPEDIANRLAIVCKDVPASINSHFELRKHFNKFGSVAKVYPNVGKRSATIHFKSHEDAANAKLKGHVIIRGQPPLHIFWSSHGPNLRSSVSGKTRETKPAVRSTTSRLSRKAAKSELDDELASMAGTSDVSEEPYHSLERPDLSPRKSPTRKPLSHSPQRSVSPSRVPVLPASPQKSATSTAATKASMEVLLTPAKNTLDMYMALDARDKLFKQGRKKQSDLKTAKAVSGTCPDMCPEKERYDRDAKRRLSVWEIVPGTENVPGQNPKVDHMRAVKEYSRSSADQEEPLPLEMRPGPVLEMTMTYLLTEIADKGDERIWLDWYDFLWNRTRGIRKDITQQMLCDRTAVGLTEKCARFHVYCAERLCEEDSHTFDQKINTENLTKCLQSLKELYADLASKQQVHCSTEAEFRAYMVLMNLNEGDTLREVQQLRQEVRESPEINFALLVYSALNSNNYSRFFKLAKRATFLNACIMHRYFVQVRSRALKTMLRAYAIGGRPVQFPLIELVRTLAFEDTEEASDFCQHYGLTAKGGEVLLDRGAYIEPETGLYMRRALHLIESKLQVSVGDVINGGPLPPLTLHVPNSSFDEMGKYRGEIPAVSSFPTDVEKRTKTEVPVGEDEVTPTFAPAPPKPPKLQVPNEVVKEIAKELFLEVIDEFSLDISSSLYKAIHVYLETNSAELWESTYEDVSAPMIRAMCSDILENEREKKRKEEEIAARIALRERAARSEMDDMIEEVVSQEIVNITTAEIRDVHAQLKQARLERCAEVIEGEICLEVADDILQEVAEEVFEVDVIQRQKQLHELEKCVQLYRTAKFFQTWKKMFTSRSRLKRSMLTFPCAPSGGSLEDQVNSLIPLRDRDRIHEGTIYINKVAKLHVQSPLVADEKQRWLDGRITLYLLMNRLRHDVAWSPFNLGEFMGKQLSQTLKSQTKSQERRLYWKLILSLPEVADNAEDHSAMFCDWLRSKFTKGAVPLQESNCEKVQTLSLYTTPLRFPHQPVLHFGVCVKAITGTLQDEEVEILEEDNTLLGTGAVLFALDPQEEEEDMDYWLEAQLRLVRVLQAKPVCPGLPLVVVLPTSIASFPPTGRIYDLLNLLSLITDGLVSSVQIVTLECSPATGVDILSHTTSNQLEEAIRWFGSHLPAQPELVSKPLQALIEEYLAAEFYSPVFHNLKQRKVLGHLHQPPDVLISLYNAVITHVQKLVTAPTLKVHSWPVTEFTYTHRDLPRPYWNSENHLAFLHNTLQSLLLPDLDFQNMESDTWDQACADVWAFISAIVEGQEEGSQKTHLMSRVRNLLHKTEKDFEDTCFLVEADRTCEPLYVNMPWTDMIMAAIDYGLLSTDFNDPNQDEMEELMVYHGTELPPFDSPWSWKMAVSDRETAAGTMINSTIHKAAEKKRQLSLESKDETSTVKKVRFSTGAELLFDVTPLSEEAVIANSVSTSLMEALAEEKRESGMFEDFLLKALHSEGDLRSESPQHPLFVVTDPTFFTSIPSLPPDVKHEQKFSPGFTPKLHINEDTGRYERVLSMDPDTGMESPETITQSLNTLKEEITSNKRANELYEMRLQALLNS